MKSNFTGYKKIEVSMYLYYCIIVILAGVLLYEEVNAQVKVAYPNGVGDGFTWTQKREIFVVLPIDFE